MTHSLNNKVLKYFAIKWFNHNLTDHEADLIRNEIDRVYSEYDFIPDADVSEVMFDVIQGD